MIKGKIKQEKKFCLFLLVAFVVTLGVISGLQSIISATKSNKYKPTLAIKSEKELLDVLESQSGSSKLVFDKSIPTNDLNKEIIMPVSDLKYGTFEELESGDFKSNIDEYYVNFQVIQMDDNGILLGVFSSVNVYVDGEASEISKYEEDLPSNSKYTFKSKGVDKVKWDITFKYPEKFIKDFINNFNNDKTNKKNNIVMSYQLKIGVDENKDEK